MEVKSDIEIAQACAIKPIRDIAAVAGVDEEYLEYYGKYTSISVSFIIIYLSNTGL